MTTYVVTTAADTNNPQDGQLSLREAIDLANANAGADAIEFDGSLLNQPITLASFLPVITDDLDIVGFSRNGTIISGDGTTRIFFVGGETAGVNVTISHVTLQNGLAKGGDGSGNSGMGGGGLGAGGAVFVRGGASVTIDDVVFDGNAAIGGNGGSGGESGHVNAGGGGGLGGDAVFSSATNAGGGGGGAFADGTAGTGTASSSVGGIGGGPNGGAGGSSGSPSGQDGGDLSGGGGAGGLGSVPGVGGAGGFGGGGGGGGIAWNGGAVDGVGGHGGYGGGGGGAAYDSAGGEGGFGGGGGAGGSGAIAAGGYGGGDGGATPNSSNAGVGGGGAAFGGSVFLMDGASLTITGTVITYGGGVTGGSGYQNGTAAGSFLFLQHTGVTFGGGGTQDITDTIADDYGNPDADNDGTTDDASAGGGVTITGGTVILSAVNTYHGATTVQAGTLRVDGSVANSAVTVKSGATIGGFGGTTGALTVESSGHVTPGASGDPGALHTGNLSLASGADFTVSIDNGSFPFDPQSFHGYSYIGVTGTVSLGGATLTMLSDDDFAPSSGESYTIIGNDGSDAVSGTFAGLDEGATFIFEGETLRISYVGGDGNDVVLSYVAQNLPADAKNDTINITGKTIGYTPWVAGPTQAVATDPDAEFSDNGLVSNFFSGNTLTLSVGGYYDSYNTYHYSLPGSSFVFTSVSRIDGGAHGINPSIVDGALVVDHATMEAARPVTLGFTVGLKENGSFSGDLFADNGNGADSDPDGDAFSVTQINGANVVDGQVIVLPSGASLTIHADGTFSYDTNHAFDSLTDGQTAQESFTYTITGGATATMSFAVVGLPDNQPAVAKDDPGIGIIGSLYGSTAVSNAWIENNGNYMFTDLSVDAAGVGHIWFGDQPGVDSYTSSNVHFSIGPNFVITSATINPSTGASGSYGPATVTNGTIEVLAHPNIIYADGPLLIDFTAGLREGASFDGDLFADNGNGADNDPDGDPVFVTHINGAAVTDGQIVTLPSGARLTIHTDGTFSYDTNHAFDSLNDGQTASESFTYTITGGSTATASFMIVGEGIGDTTPPTITIGTIAGNDVVNAAEGAATITVSGTAAGAEDGQTVTLWLKTIDGSTGLQSMTTTVSGGAWQIDLPPGATPAFPDGPYLITADVSDQAGNPAPQASRTITVDTHAPSLTIGTIAGNDVVNAAEGAATIKVSGTAAGAEDGRTVTLALKTGNGAITLQTMTAVVAAGLWHIDLPPGATPAFPDGPYLVTANVSDAAGNPAMEATHAIAVDTHPPVLTINPIAGDDVVTAAEGAGAITVSGTASGAEDGQTVTLALKTADGSATLQSMATTVSGGEWHLDLPPGATPAFPNGPYLVTANVSDAAGNPATEASRGITVDVVVASVAPSLFQHIGTGAPGPHGGAYATPGVSDGFFVVGTGDFNGDGTTDVLWRDPAGRVDEWNMQNESWANSIYLGARGTDWQVAGTGDFNGDGTSDVLWRNPTTGQLDAWIMQNGQWSRSVDLGGRGTDWKVLGTGDFNGDGTDDILFQNSKTGMIDGWQMADGNWSKSLAVGGARDLAYSSVAIGDFDGDGTSDVMWRNPTTGAVDEWHIKDGNWAGSIDLGTFNTGYELAAVNDFDGNGTADVLWRNPTTGNVDGWVMAHGQWFASVSLGAFDPAYHLGGTGDFNHAGGADILWHNTATGQTTTWLLGPV